MRKKVVKIGKSNPSIKKCMHNCKHCGICTYVCKEIVGIDRTNEKKFYSTCINCGLCVLKCPFNALEVKEDYFDVLEALRQNKKVAISIAPAVRVALLDEFGNNKVINAEDILPSVLRKMGFTYVFDMCFGADMTIMEEARELFDRLANNEKLPMYTSCCPAWVKYAGIYHPEILKNLSTTNSPMAMQSSLIKSYYRKMNNITDEIMSVVVAPCSAKKYEATLNDTDYVITTKELATLIKLFNIDLSKIKPSSFDSMLSMNSKCGLMFGRSGGVMESSLNYLHFLITDKVPEKGLYHLEINDSITTKEYKIGSYNVKVAVVYGMPNLEKLLLKQDKYDFIEVMNCNGGCISGAGQPYFKGNNEEETKKQRTNELNSIKKEINYCFENPEIIDCYNNYLNIIDEDKKHELLHTKHLNLSYKLKRRKKIK